MTVNNMDQVWLLGTDGRSHLRLFAEATHAICGMPIAVGLTARLSQQRPRCISCEVELMRQSRLVPLFPGDKVVFQVTVKEDTQLVSDAAPTVAEE